LVVEQSDTTVAVIRSAFMIENEIDKLPAPSLALEFHYKAEGQKRPNDENENTEFFVWKPGSNIPIPDVGDTVSYTSWKHNGPDSPDGHAASAFRKVVTRHFHVSQEHIGVYLVVTDVSKEEKAARIKE
jgi:hypothetical protein